MALTVLDVFKLLPRTNCGECGDATCLAFATRVVKEGEELGRCPYVSTESGAARALKAQQQSGVGRRRESLAIALEALQDKVANLDFAALADGIGAVSGREDGRDYLVLPFFNLQLKVFKDKVVYPQGSEANPWDAILFYNYIASQGRQDPTGKWITFQSLPNSVSKTKTLKRLEGQLAEHYAGRGMGLRERAAILNGEPIQAGEDADLAAVFRPLPKVPILLQFWEAEPEENFPAQASFLFDATVSHYLDLESLLFLVERLLDRLME